MQEELQRILTDHPFVEMAYVADGEGKLVSWNTRTMEEAGAELLRLGMDCTNRPWFANAVNSNNPFISEVYKSLVSGEDCFSVSVGVFDDARAGIGVIVIDINSNEWNKIVQ